MTLYCPDENCAIACPDGYPVTCSIEYVNSGQDQTVVVATTADTKDMKFWGRNDPVRCHPRVRSYAGQCGELLRNKME